MPRDSFPPNVKLTPAIIPILDGLVLLQLPRFDWKQTLLAVMAQAQSSVAENFSLTRGGPMHWVLVRLGHAGDGRRLVVRRALAVILITWLPLLLLSLLQGLAWRRQIIDIPFLRDFAVNVRLLIAVPILIMAESAIDKRWRSLVLQFLRSELVDEKTLPSFEAVLERTMRWRDRVLPEALLVVAAIFPSLFFVKTELLMTGTSNWHDLGTRHIERGRMVGCSRQHPSLPLSPLTMVLEDVSLDFFPLERLQDQPVSSSHSC